MKACINCGGVIEAARLEALPETDFCIACSRKIGTPKVREAGRRHYAGLELLGTTEGGELKGLYKE